MKVFTAFCDLKFCPVSYDFVTWMVTAMHVCQKHKADRMHIVIVPDEQGTGGFARHWGGHDEHETRWRLWHIVMAAVPLSGATVTLAPSRAMAEEIYSDPRDQYARQWWPEGKAHFMGPLVDAARDGEVTPQLRATEQARRYVAQWPLRNVPQYVTFTTRKMDRDLSRNSDMAAWEALEDRAHEAGYECFSLDDTGQVLKNGPLGTLASLDPDLRLALYERAAMNFCANTGPQELLKFSDAAFTIFGQGLDGWADHFRQHFHMEPGDQLPWAAPDQKLVYEKDSAEVLLREFNAWHAGP